MDYKTLYEKASPNKLFATVAIPGIISMLVSSLYQILDGAFVGKLLGATAFAAVNLAMPMVIINFAISDLVGVGSAIPIAIKLGEKKEEEACNIFSAACLMIVAAGAVLGALLFVFAEKLALMMGADSTLAALAADYLKIYALFSPFITILFAVDNYLKICGKVKYSMMINILMSVLSAAFEALFLIVFKMGIYGAALGCASGMFICVLIGFMPFFFKKTKLRFTKPKITKEVLTAIITNGMPIFLDNVSGRITSLFINSSLLKMGGNDGGFRLWGDDVCGRDNVSRALRYVRLHSARSGL